jgi:hypothetical protein
MVPVFVEWADSEHKHGWQDSLAPAWSRDLRGYSLGWLLGERAESIYIALTVAAIGHHAQPCEVPTSAIRRLVRLDLSGQIGPLPMPAGEG